MKKAPQFNWIQLIAGMVMLGVLLLILRFFAGVMLAMFRLLHFQFASKSSAGLFFVLYFLGDFFLISYVESFVNVAAELTNMPKGLHHVLYAVASICIKIILITAIDWVMGSVDIPFYTVVLFSVLLFLVERILDLWAGGE